MKSYIKYSSILLMLFFLIQPLAAQKTKVRSKKGNKITVNQNTDLKLAQQYFQKGEYEKATPLFKKLYEGSPTNSYNYRNYLKCLVFQKKFDASQELIKNHFKKKKNDPSMYIDLGYVYRQQEEPKKAEEQFNKAISKIGNNANEARSMASVFNQLEEPDYVIKAYKKGRDMTGDQLAFAYELAMTYKKQGDYENMVGSYLDYVQVKPQKVQQLKNEFQGLLKMEKYKDIIQSKLYKKIQKNPDELIFPELLIWFFIQEKDFDSAFMQVKALDKRMNENGMRVFDLAQSALIENQFDASIDAYQYVIDKGIDNPMYVNAKQALVGAKMKRLEYNNEYNEEDLKVLEQDFLTMLDEFGRNEKTTGTMKRLSQLYANYIFDLDKAIAILEEIIAMPNAQKQIKARSKLDLGDYNIMKGDIWESTLFYSQVDKEFKDDILGEEARFRNAKLSYYTGDFEWAQAQLNILKASTSELISNDAIDLGVFIIDNLGMDTIPTALNMFARADLLIFQNKAEESYIILDSIETMFTGHALADDIAFRRGTIEYKKRNYEKAAEYWEKVVAEYLTDILADNAIFNLAELYERHLNQTDKAKEYYSRILIDFPSSLYTAEARKRFRRLRGDNIN